MSLYQAAILAIPHATDEQTDAAQYMFRNGKKQYNLCGEFCVAYCMQDNTGSKNIDEYLDYWQAKSLKWYQSIFQNGLARTTGIYDLQMMLAAYGVETPCLSFAKVFLTPRDFMIRCKTHQAIVGVQIDHSGYLVGKGILHWIVLEDVFPLIDDHAICDIYNPFTNALEPYSWRELMNSTGAYKYGIWIER